MRLLPESDSGDFLNPNPVRNEFAEVEALGDPWPEMFTEDEIRNWPDSCPYQPGDKVLLPKQSGRELTVGDNVYKVFWQYEIEVYYRNGG